MCGGLVIVVIINFGISMFVILILVCETYSYGVAAAVTSRCLNWPKVLVICLVST